MPIEILAYLFYDVLCDIPTPEPQKIDVAFNVDTLYKHKMQESKRHEEFVDPVW